MNENFFKQIRIFYRGTGYRTTFIIEECYLLEFLASLVREDIERVEITENE